MRLRNQELMEEFYNRNLSQFPGLTLEQFTTICHTQFQFLRQCIDKARYYSKPVIIATQMMETMISSLTPTRAEVNDVANNVLS